MPELILAIDIGNTNIHFGIFTTAKKLIAEEKIDHKRLKQFLKQWQKNIKPLHLSQSEIVSSVRTILLASTRPETDPILNQWANRVFKTKPLRFHHDFKAPCPILVNEPKKVGVDRILNALAAYEKTQRATVVIDFGTAITFDVVSDRGEFLGGAIAPGLDLMTRSLHQNCSLLPLIKPKPVSQVIGKNTAAAMQAGLYFGTIGLVNQILDRITQEFKKTPAIIATGSNAFLFKSALPKIKKIIPTLTLEGLILAYLKTKNKSR
ncbi:MAG: type III pantothenate kinase [Planctomycetes bacterium]|nr:type III pantothenate kinase [Planctomycetota bacterium]